MNAAPADDGAERGGQDERRHVGELVLVQPRYLAVSLDGHYDAPAQVSTIPPIDERAIHRHDLAQERSAAVDEPPPP